MTTSFRWIRIKFHGLGVSQSSGHLPSPKLFSLVLCAYCTFVCRLCSITTIVPNMQCSSRHLNNDIRRRADDSSFKSKANFYARIATPTFSWLFTQPHEGKKQHMWRRISQHHGIVNYARTVSVTSLFLTLFGRDVLKGALAKNLH